MIKYIISGLLKRKGVLKLYNKIYNKFKSLVTLKKNYSKLYKNMAIYKDFTKKITFDFKGLMLFNKYAYIYNIFFTPRKFNFFISYFYNRNPCIPYIYNMHFEEPFIDGPIEFNISNNHYNYLNDTIYRLYNFYN
jgi:hypothetical protein